MKHLLKTALLASVGAALLTPAAKAQNTYNAGDMLLGFEFSGQAHDVVFDLGNISQFTSGASFNLSTVGYSASTLATEFGLTGTDFTSTTALRWSVLGDTSDGNTIFATKARSSVNTQSTPWVNASSTSLELTAGKLDSMGNQYQSATGGNSFLTGTATAINSANASSVTKLQAAAGKMGGTFQGNTLNTLPSSGTAVSDLYSVGSSDIVGSGNGNFNGFFTFDTANGAMTFTGVVPEPSSYALFACATVTIFLFGRTFRRQQT